MRTSLVESGGIHPVRGKIIKRLRRLFAEPVFAGLLVVVGFALLNWPFVDLARRAGSFALFRYWFTVWGALVVLAALLAWAAGRRADDSDV
jgi:hypothetical protein